LLLDYKDAITNFSRAEADKIDLSVINANANLAGDKAFTLIGTAAFGRVAGQLQFVTSAGQAHIMADTNGDGTSDFPIALLNGPALIPSDFVL
jgi:hypothetical protein